MIFPILQDEGLPAPHADTGSIGTVAKSEKPRYERGFHEHTTR
jgi:hypothetical protein